MKIDLFCHHHPDRRAQIIWLLRDARPLCWPCANERLKELNHERLSNLENNLPALQTARNGRRSQSDIQAQGRERPLLLQGTRHKNGAPQPKSTRPTIDMMKAKKLLVKSTTGAIHIQTATGMMCGRSFSTRPYDGTVEARDLCGRCLAVLGAIWEPLARPGYERRPF